MTQPELYLVIQLRLSVFVVEQNCPYQDCDNRDQPSWHLMAWEKEKLVAYSRLIPPGIAYPEASIGRVVTLKTMRGTHTGKELMKQSVDKIYSLFGKVPITIGAQLYLKGFYESGGFTMISDVYLEDGIEHIKMRLP
ncbi:MAG: GNAT family N-acetyltransferase [Ginsengibacter sp.]